MIVPTTHSEGMNQEREYLFKVLIIGELATGKTAVIKRYVHKFFPEHYKATVKSFFTSFSLVESFYSIAWSGFCIKNTETR